MTLSRIAGNETPITPIESKQKVSNTKYEQPNQQRYELHSLSKERLNEKETKHVVDTLNGMLGMTDTHLKFKYHEKTGEYYVQLVNNQNDEVVKEIPSKKMLDISAAMQDFIGLVINKKA